jgi:hypothetical protein
MRADIRLAPRDRRKESLASSPELKILFLENIGVTMAGRLSLQQTSPAVSIFHR